MLKSDAIHIVSNDKEYYSICKKIGGRYGDDLFQELVLIFLEMDAAKFESIINIKWYWVRIAKNQFDSRTSSFYKKYKKFSENTNELTNEVESDDDSDIDFKVSIAKKELDKLTWYERELFNVHMEMGSCRKVSERIGIPFRSVAYSVSETKRILKNKINAVINY